MRPPEYNAASSGRRLRVWRPHLTGPNAVVARNVPTIRNRARAAVRNDPWAGSASDRLVSNMIATGIQAKMVNGTDAQKAAVKALWDRQCKVIDADGVLDFYGLQALVAREWAGEVGECFARIRRRRASDGLPVPFQIQIIEAEQVPNSLNTTASNGNRIRQGIEFNAFGQRVAYWMYREHPGDVETFNGSELVRVPAEDVIHVFEPLRAGQIRGVPYSASALVPMFNVDSLNDASMERQKVANLFAGFFISGPDPEATPGAIAGMQGDSAEEAVDGTPLAGLEPGTMGELPPGMKPVFSTPPDAGANYMDFWRGQLLAVAARYGVPYEVLTGDLRDVSDRALRLILNEFRRLIEMRQWLYLIPQFCQRVREAFFDAAVLYGALVLAQYDSRRSEYVDTLWVPEGWPYSHPVQDVDADIKAIRAGLTSRSDVVLSNGGDAEGVDARQAADNERADKIGLKYDSDGRQKKEGEKPQSQGQSQAAASAPQPNVTVNVPEPQIHIEPKFLMPHTIRLEQPVSAEERALIEQALKVLAA